MMRSMHASYFAAMGLAVACAAWTVQSANSQEKTPPASCGNQEADKLLRQGHSTFPKGGYGLPHIVAAAGQALAYFNLAVEKDPTCAQAQVALAKAEIGFPSWPGLPPEERFAKAKEAATRAIALQDSLAEAHALLGEAEFNTWQWEPAEKELKRAIELAPDDARYRAYYGQFLAAMGRSTQAIKQAEKARELAHGSPQIDVAAGAIYYWARRYDKAIELISPAVNSAPMDNFLLGWACIGKSKWQEAINAFTTIVPLTDRDAGDVMSLAYAYASAGRRSEVPPMLEEVKQKTTLMYVPVYRIAATYLAMGDKEQALEWLQKASTDDRGWMVWLKVDPVMDPLRSDPRFQNLLRNMKFP